jgi:hypothetical protein
MGRTRTLRGRVGPGETVQLIVDDGRYRNGYKIKAFFAWSPTFSNNGFAVLSYSDVPATSANAGDSRQIAWANYADGTTNITSTTAIIDPDHIVQQDLYVHANSAELSYLIVLETIELTESQGILQLVKADQQSDDD